MPRYVVVTGTDTGVGKTWITAALAHLLVRRGTRVLALKPFESGVSTDEPGDGEALADATGQETPRRALVRLRAPLAPAMAAEREGVTLDYELTVAGIRELSGDAEVVFVEGAGGVLSPLTWASDATTLAHSLEAAVVLVASDRLGTLSAVHTAVQCLVDTWLSPTAIVLSAPSAPDASTGSNLAALKRRLAAYEGVADRIVALGRDEASGAALERVLDLCWRAQVL